MNPVNRRLWTRMYLRFWLRLWLRTNLRSFCLHSSAFVISLAWSCCNLFRRTASHRSRLHLISWLHRPGLSGWPCLDRRFGLSCRSCLSCRLSLCCCACRSGRSCDCSARTAYSCRTFRLTGRSRTAYRGASGGSSRRISCGSSRRSASCRCLTRDLLI